MPLRISGEQKIDPLGDVNGWSGCVWRFTARALWNSGYEKAPNRPINNKNDKNNKNNNNKNNNNNKYKNNNNNNKNNKNNKNDKNNKNYK